MGKNSVDTKTAQKTKKSFLNDIFVEQNQIGPNPRWNGHGDKTCKWISMLVHFNLINQTINRMTECPQYVSEICPEFAPKRFYVSLHLHVTFKFHILFLESKQKTEI